MRFVNLWLKNDTMGDRGNDRKLQEKGYREVYINNENQNIVGPKLRELSYRKKYNLNNVNGGEEAKGKYIVWGMVILFYTVYI
jgi:hypothetical protein